MTAVDEPPVPAGRLEAHDLIPDRELGADQRDLLGHTAIAERVADLLLEGELPLNVAIFAPWGSGKSSFAQLVKNALERDDDSPRAWLVTYDVWKYGGSSLQRNFISHVARELGLSEGHPDHRKYFRGLYEKRKTVDIDVDEVGASRRWRLFVQTALLLAAFLSLVVLFRGVAALIGGDDVVAAVASALADYGPVAAALAIAAAAGLKLIEGGRVEMEQDAPSSDDHFSTTFRALVDHARSACKYDRLVFYIDELDRCEPDDVLRTLTQIKTFLDEKGCAFIVAADREALLSALSTALPSSSAGAQAEHEGSTYSFIDKVFQHQLSLPPLRIGTPADYAFALVRERGGLWDDLTRAEPHLRALTAVLYALIAPHVTNPRRIKVLLNAFATNARMAEARGLPWKERAREIAKLTALQTEFPEIREELMRRREGSLDDPEVINQVPPGVARERLRLYLTRTRRIPDPQPDLLYSGLADPTLSLAPDLERFVEIHAAEQDQILDRLAREPERRLAVARFLMQIADSANPADRGPLISTLLAVSDELAAATGDLVPGVAETVEDAARSGNLRHEDVAPALRAAARVGLEVLAPLIDSIITNRGRSPTAWLLPLLAYEAQLTDAQRRAIQASLARTLNERRAERWVSAAEIGEELSSFLAGLAEEPAEWLIYNREIVAAAAGCLSLWQQEPANLVDWARRTAGMVDRAAEASFTRRAGLYLWALRTDVPDAYDLAGDEVRALVGAVAPRVASLLVVAAMARAPVEEISSWRGRLEREALAAEDAYVVRDLVQRTRVAYGGLGEEIKSAVEPALLAAVEALPAKAKHELVREFQQEVERADRGAALADGGASSAADPAEVLGSLLRLPADTRAARERV